MQLLLLVLIFVSGMANADLYKCANGSKSSYQDHPCDGESKTTLLQKNHTRSMAGCYSIDFKKWEIGTKNERFRVTSIGNGEYTMDGIGKKPSGSSIPMKTATADELREVGDAFKFSAKDGISIKWNKDTPNQKPIGFYRGTDSQGQAIILAFFFLENGLAKEIPCP